MSEGFYRRLEIQQNATLAEIRAAFQRKSAFLMRRLQQARALEANDAAVQQQLRQLREAYEVLSDPRRRRMYDCFRLCNQQHYFTNSDAFWNIIADSLVEPQAAAAAEILRLLTQLPLGEDFSPMRAAQQLLHQQDEAAVQAAREQASAGRGQRGRDPRVPLRIQIPGPGQDPRGRVPSTSGVTEVYHTNEAPSAPQAGPPAKPQWSMWGPRRPGTHSEASSYAESTHRPSSQAGWGGWGGGEPGYGGPPQESPQELARRFGGYDGRFIQARRKQLGIQLSDVQEGTGIQQGYLQAIESNNYKQLQRLGETYLKGYLRQIAGQLAVDPGALVSSYMERVHRNRRL